MPLPETEMGQMRQGGERQRPGATICAFTTSAVGGSGAGQKQDCRHCLRCVCMASEQGQSARVGDTVGLGERKKELGNPPRKNDPQEGKHSKAPGGPGEQGKKAYTKSAWKKKGSK